MRTNKSHLKKLYRILWELDCELQNLGARGDYGIFATPEFAVETLTSCIQFISKQPKAHKNLLREAAQDLVDTEMHRTLPQVIRSYTGTAWVAANDANTAQFKALVETYRGTFKFPEES